MSSKCIVLNTITNRCLNYFQSSRSVWLSRNFATTHRWSSSKETVNTEEPMLTFSSKLINTRGQLNRPKWNRVINEAEKLVGFPNVFENLKGIPGDDIFSILTEVRKLLGTNHPLLKIAKRLIYNGRNNMQVRGLIVLLIANIAGCNFENLMKRQIEQEEITNKQRELSEIVEIIHTAHFVHKSVVNVKNLVDCDEEDIKDAQYGNKVAILIGDYLLANASMKLSGLENLKVLSLMTLAIKNFVEGEFIFPQDKHGLPYPTASTTVREWEMKNYLCSGSLLANGCRSATILSNLSDEVQALAFEFGKQLALAWQVYFDLQIFADGGFANQGPTFDLSSLPVIMHLEKDPSLLKVISSHQQHLEELDYKQMRSVIMAGSGLEDAKELATKYTEDSLRILQQFPASDFRAILENIIKATIFEPFI